MGGGGVGSLTRGGVIANMGEVGMEGSGSSICFGAGTVEAVEGAVDSGMDVAIEGDGWSGEGWSWSGGADVIPGNDWSGEG